MEANVDTELRKLRPAEIYSLGLILNPSDNWKKLMSSVTKDDNESVPKFPGDYIAIIEEAARQERKLASTIFLEEWATMGKKRPTVGLLLDLLMKTELFRAADYVAQDVLKIEAPLRPTCGPAAAVDVDAIADLLLKQNIQSESSSDQSNFCLRSTDQMRLSQVDYPMGVFNTSASTNDDNLADEVGFIEMRYAESKSHQILDQPQPIVDNRTSNMSNDIDISKSQIEISDLMKFSSESSIKNNVPRSDLIKFESGKVISENGNEICEALMPDFNILRGNKSSELKISENKEVFELQNAELTSAELPACLGRLKDSIEIPEIVKEFQNPYFHRELVSAELPLCINDKLGDDSEENNNFSEEFPSEEENSSMDSSDRMSSEILEAEQREQEISMPEIPCFVLEAGRERNEEKDLEDVKIGFSSQELPLTVLEFQKG